MKFIAIILLVISCASQDLKKDSEHNAARTENKYSYLQDFYKIRDELYKKTKTCKKYSEKHLRQVLIPENKASGTLGYKFINTIKIPQYLNDYDPKQFDWYLSAKLKTLYLNYPKLDAVAKEHFEISNSIHDCSNEFDNLTFLHSAIDLWSNKNISNQNKNLIKKVFERYFNYISEQEVSLLNVLVTNSLLQRLEEKGFITFKDKDQYLADSRELELLYTKTGQSILKLFQEKNYLDIYDQDKQLRNAKQDFKAKMMKAFKYR